MRSAVRGVLLAALLLASGAALGQGRPSRPGDFDLWVLSLSWSPTYCLTEGEARGDRRQCGTERPFAFVLHGLWPQWERGFPEYCLGDRPPRIPDPVVSAMLDVMPSPGLVIHQWRRHGACSGLPPAAYFDAARRAYARVAIPEAFRGGAAAQRVAPAEVERAFLAANPGLAPEMVAVTCRDGLLQEVRVCLSRTFQPRRCAEVDRNACRAASVEVPPARAGR